MASFRKRTLTVAVQHSQAFCGRMVVLFNDAALFDELVYNIFRPPLSTLSKLNGGQLSFTLKAINGLRIGLKPCGNIPRD